MKNENQKRIWSNMEILGLLNRIDMGYQPLEEEKRILLERTELDISCSSISALPESVGLLSNLQSLNLSRTHITSLSDSIRLLTNLQTLNLSHTRITALPVAISQLTKLQFLNLWHTPITTLPESIGQLTNLHTLNLLNSKITDLPESVGQLVKLQILNLGNTNISALPESLKQLPELRWLRIWGTQIRSLPDWVGELPALQYLDLEGLTLRIIPESLTLRGLPFVINDRAQKGIVLKGVTLLEQRMSIFLEHPELIPSLYQKEQQAVQECRVIFLGDGEVGKSYTIKRFRNHGKKETEAETYLTSETPGVEILDYPVVQGTDSFKIHFWDFGGQQLLHSMHRCFLTEETCYVVTVKTRETQANERARYWLRNVAAFAPNSPVLLFVNCWENDDGRRSIDEPGLRRDFPMMKNVLYCSAKQAEEVEFRVTLMEPILQMAAESEGVSKLVPVQWVRVREAIETESETSNYLDKARYHAICTEYGVENEEAPALLSYFNNIGVCFSYHRDREKRELADYRLLNPVWLTNAIYAVIEEGMAYAKDGRIQRSAVEQMLGNQAPQLVRGKANYRRTVPNLRYTADECRYVVDIAAVHDLCYAVDEDRVFFPALCTNNTPQEALNEPSEYPEHGAYCFKYEYLPDSVVHQLMVRCLRKGYVIDHCWLRGIVLGCLDEHRAIVRMTEGERLRLEIYSKKGRMPYDLFRVLRNEILDITERLNMKCQEYILNDPDSFRLTTLLLDREEGVAFKRGESSNEKFEIRDSCRRCSPSRRCRFPPLGSRCPAG